jgi:hypothetical protein
MAVHDPSPFFPSLFLEKDEEESTDFTIEPILD